MEVKPAKFFNLVPYFLAVVVVKSLDMLFAHVKWCCMRH